MTSNEGTTNADHGSDQARPARRARAPKDTKGGRKKKVGFHELQASKAHFDLLKTQLLEAMPDLDDIENHSTLLDTLQGMTSLEDMLVKLLHESREADAQAKALKDREKVLVARRKRFERRNETLRTIVKKEMVRIGRHKIGDVEIDAGVRLGAEKLVVLSSGDDLPDELVTIRTVRDPNKEAIEAALRSDNKEIVEATKPFAIIEPADWILTVRSS